MPKVLVIGPRGIPAKHGGIEVHAEEIYTRMAEQRWEVTLLARAHYTDKTKPFLYQGIRVIPIKSLQSKSLETLSFSFFASLKALWMKADIIHYHGLGPGFFAFLLAWKCPVIITIHGRETAQPDNWGKLAQIYFHLSEFFLRFIPHKVIVVSHALQKYYHPLGKKTVFLPNGANIQEAPDTEILQEFNLEKEKYFLFVGRFLPNKGVHYLLEAYRKLSTDIPLVLAGDAVYRDKYRKQLEELSGDKVHFLGFQYGEKLKALIAHCALFLLPSRSEGMSIALLEAMSYGRCALVSDIPENLEVIGEDAGIPFQSETTEDLRKQWEECIQDQKKLTRIGKAAKEKIRKEFQWEDIAEKTIELYRQALPTTH